MLTVTAHTVSAAKMAAAASSSFSSPASPRTDRSWMADGFVDDRRSHLSRGSVSCGQFVSSPRQPRSVASPRNGDCLSSELRVADGGGGGGGGFRRGFAIDFCCVGSNGSSPLSGGGGGGGGSRIRPMGEDGSSYCGGRSKDSRRGGGGHEDQLPSRRVAERISEESFILRHRKSPAIQDRCRWERPMHRRPKSGPTQPIQQITRDWWSIPEHCLIIRGIKLNRKTTEERFHDAIFHNSQLKTKAATHRCQGAVSDGGSRSIRDWPEEEVTAGEIQRSKSIVSNAFECPEVILTSADNECDSAVSFRLTEENLKNLGSVNDYECRILIDDYGKESEAGCLKVPGLQPSDAEEEEEDLLPASSTSTADSIIRASNCYLPHQLPLAVPENQDIHLSEDYAMNIPRGEGDNLTKSIAERDDSTGRADEVETTADAEVDVVERREMADGCRSDAAEEDRSSNASRRKIRRGGVGRKVNVFNAKARKSMQRLSRTEKKDDRMIRESVGTTQSDFSKKKKTSKKNDRTRESSSSSSVKKTRSTVIRPSTSGRRSTSARRKVRPKRLSSGEYSSQSEDGSNCADPDEDSGIGLEPGSAVSRWIVADFESLPDPSSTSAVEKDSGAEEQKPPGGHNGRRPLPSGLRDRRTRPKLSDLLTLKRALRSMEPHKSETEFGEREGRRHVEFHKPNQGQIALSQRACRFELPVDMRLFERLSPQEYLHKYCRISSRRQTLYKRIFAKYAIGGSVPHKDLLRVLGDLFDDAVTARDVLHVCEVLQIDGETRFDLDLLSMTAAVTERLLYPQFLTQHTKHMAEYQKEEVETADFSSLLRKLDGIQIRPELKRLVDAIK